MTIPKEAVAKPVDEKAEDIGRIADLYHEVMGKQHENLDDDLRGWGQLTECCVQGCTDHARWILDDTTSTSDDPREDGVYVCDQHVVDQLPRDRRVSIIPWPDPPALEAMGQAVEES